jgi:energy-coupling factor transport system ATP-binding protein
VVMLSVASIELWNVVVRLGGRDVLKGVTASFEPGVHVVLGRNGAGKTTLLRAIAGLVKFDGEVRVLGKSVRGLGRRELARLVAYCWQNPYYGFIEATVEDEVRAILRILGVEGDWRVAELLVPRELMGRDPATLSGGEAKRVSMASMLVADQPVWLLDEPFTYLDREGVEAVAKLIEYARKKGKTVIVTLHEVFYASLVKPDTFIALDSGAVVASGRWDELSDKTLNSIGLVPRGALCATLCS